VSIPPPQPLHARRRSARRSAGRSAVNRERFIRRFKDEIKRASTTKIGKRGIADIARAAGSRSPAAG